MRKQVEMLKYHSHLLSDFVDINSRYIYLLIIGISNGTARSFYPLFRLSYCLRKKAALLTKEAVYIRTIIQNE